MRHRVNETALIMTAITWVCLLCFLLLPETEGNHYLKMKKKNKDSFIHNPAPTTLPQILSKHPVLFCDAPALIITTKIIQE